MIGNIKHVMLVDDDEATNYFHNIIIDESGITADVIIHEFAAEALEYLKSHVRPGIIFLDINMPGMNGWDFMAEFEKLPAAQKDLLTVVILTTSENPQDRIIAYDIPDIKQFLIKPLSTKVVRDVVANYFG